MTQKTYKCGDKVWIYSIDTKTEYKNCNICNGTGFVIIVPSNCPIEAGTKMQCESCVHSNGGVGKMSTNRSTKVNVGQVTIDGMDVRCGVIVEYRYESGQSSWKTLAKDKVFETDIEAATAGEIELNEKNKISEAYIARQNSIQYSSYSRSLGYHKEAIQRCRNEVEYHRQRLNLSPEEFDEWINSLKQYGYKPKVKKDTKIKSQEPIPEIKIGITDG